MSDDRRFKQREQEFEDIVDGIYEATDDPLVQLFAIAIGTAARYAKELVVDKISLEKNKEIINDKLAVLERVEHSSNIRSVYTPNENEEDNLVAQIKQGDPDFNKELFEHYAEDIFRKLMIAYRDNNLDSLRKFIDSNILEILKIQAKKNDILTAEEEILIDAINYVDFFGYHIEGNLEVVSVAIGANYYDFAKDAEGNVVRGSDKVMIRSVYLLSFARKVGSKTINNIKDYKDGVAICPNCGGKIVSSYSECEFCHTILYNGTENWLLTHIEELK